MFALFSLSGCGGNSTSPMNVTVTSSAATVDATDSVTLTATVANDKTPGGVTWAVTGGGTLSNTSTTGATYTAPAASSSALTATVTATSVADATKIGTTALTVPPTPTITTGPLAANVGTAFSATLAGAGGIAPYKWTLTTGTLPTGWSLTSAGVLSGPAPMKGQAGSTNLTFELTDSGTATAATATQQLALTINPAPAIVFSNSLTNGTFNAAYSATVTATGGAGALTYTLASGPLPTGLTLSAAGVIAGMPGVAGTFPITVKAADAFGDSNTNGYSITVSYPQLKVTATTLPTGYVGSNYTLTTLAATGGSGAGYTWALASGSLLPAGLNLSAAGVITGKPTATTPASFNATVTDAALNTANGTFSITVNAALSITTATALPTGYVGSNYSKTLAATGGSGTGYTWALASGSNAPAGTNFSAAGVLSGKPTTAGAPSFTVIVTDSASNTATATFAVTISAGVTITSAATLPAGYQGTAYPGATLTATGGTGIGLSWTWAPASGSTLPAGLLLSTGGAISGLPTASGTSSIVVTVTDSALNTASATVSLTVTPTLTITSGVTLPGGVVATAYSDALAATGGSSSYVWSTNTAGTTSLATIGLTLSPAGAVSGTPTSNGTATFTGTVTDSALHTASLAFSVTVSNVLTVTTSNSLPAAYSGTLYSQTLAAAGGSGTGYTWTVTAGASSLATFNLTLSNTGVLKGTPTTTGTASFTAQVKDSASNTATLAFTVPVYGVLTLPTPNPSSLGSAILNQSYTGSITAIGGSGSGYVWTVSGLPLGGLTYSTSGSKLNIGGTPTATGNITFTASIKDSTGTSVGPNTYTIAVANALTITTSSLPPAYTNALYSQTLAATGGTGTSYTWTATSSNLANFNLTLTSGGLLSGTPATSGIASFTAKVTDSASNTATQAFTFKVYSALALPAPNPSPLGAGTTGEAYTGTIIASGGSGNYTWTVTGLPSDGLSSSPNGGTLNISGTPTTAATVQFGVSVKDTTTGVTVGPFTYSIVVSNPPALTLPTPNPGSLPSATINQSYSGSISATGGVPPYTWTVTGLPSNGLSSSSSGNTLAVAGSPTTMAAVSFTASVTDSASHTAGPNTYTINVNSAGSQVSGQIFLTTGCGGGGNVPAIRVSIDTNPVQTTTTDNNGNYSFGTVPNGNYTITPSITGASSVFYPATQSVTVSNNPVSANIIGASLGYTVSGSAAYGGAKTGQVYLTLNGGCGGNGGPGTSITEATLTGGGAYTIRGVPPGSYTLDATMDNLGFGSSNASNPSGSSSVTVTDANFTGANVTLADPAAVTLSSAPNLIAVSPFNQGAGIAFSALKNSNGVETASSYTVQWSTASGFGTVAGSRTFAATGAKSSGIWFVPGLTNASVYYFRAYGASAGTATGPYSSVIGPVTIGAPTAGFAVSGTVTFTSITATGPLYVGFYNQSTGSIYATVVGSKTSPPTSPAAYTVQVPSGTDYYNFAILDQNNNGLLNSPGEISNTHDNGNSNGVTISGITTGQDVTLTNAGSTLQVTTQFQQNSCPGCGGTSTSYNVSINLREANKLPVSATLMSGPNVINPVDLGACSNGCGTPQFQYNANIGSVVPIVGQNYGFQVQYSDGTSGTVTSSVTGVLTAAQLATNLAPTGTGGSTTPTFTWTYPVVNPSYYIYQFYICCDGNNTIWQIPGNNANINGFPSTVTQIVWGTDPTGDTGNTPSESSLNSGTYYSWQLETQDSNGNQAQTSVNYTP